MSAVGIKKLVEFMDVVTESYDLVGKSNSEIADMLEDEVSATMDSGTMEYWIVIEAVDRLKVS